MQHRHRRLQLELHDQLQAGLVLLAGGHSHGKLARLLQVAHLHRGQDRVQLRRLHEPGADAVILVRRADAERRDAAQPPEGRQARVSGG